MAKTEPPGTVSSQIGLKSAVQKNEDKFNQGSRSKLNLITRAIK